MREVKAIKEKNFCFYEAKDGVQFLDKEQCLNYEVSLAGKKNWEKRKVTLIGEEEFHFYYVENSIEDFVDFLEHICKDDEFTLTIEDFSYYMKKANKYMGHWVTYTYTPCYSENSDSDSIFFLYTLEERMEITQDTLENLQQEIYFYELLVKNNDDSIKDDILNGNNENAEGAEEENNDTQEETPC